MNKNKLLTSYKHYKIFYVINNQIKNLIVCIYNYQQTIQKEKKTKQTEQTT